jgi:hypothetical protein
MAEARAEVEIYRLPPSPPPALSPRSQKRHDLAALTTRERVFLAATAAIRKCLDRDKRRPLDLFLDARASDPTNNSDELTVISFRHLLQACGVGDLELELDALVKGDHRAYSDASGLSHLSVDTDTDAASTSAANTASSSTTRAARAGAKRRLRRARRKRISQLFRDFGATGVHNGGCLGFAMMRRQFRKGARPAPSLTQNDAEHEKRALLVSRQKNIRRLRARRDNQFPMNVLGQAPHVMLNSSLGDSVFNPTASTVTGLPLHTSTYEYGLDRAQSASLSPLNGGGSALPEMLAFEDSVAMAAAARPSISRGSATSTSSASRSRLLASMEKDSNSFLPFIQLAAASARVSMGEVGGLEDSLEERYSDCGDYRRENMDDQSRDQEQRLGDDGDNDDQYPWDGEQNNNDDDDDGDDSEEEEEEEEEAPKLPQTKNEYYNASRSQTAPSHPLDPYRSHHGRSDVEPEAWFHPGRAESIARQMEIDLILGSPSPAFDPSVPFTPGPALTPRAQSSSGPISMAAFKANPAHQISNQRGIIARAIHSRFSAAVLLELKKKMVPQTKSRDILEGSRSSGDANALREELEEKTPHRIARLLTVVDDESGGNTTKNKTRGKRKKKNRRRKGQGRTDNNSMASEQSTSLEEDSSIMTKWWTRQRMHVINAQLLPSVASFLPPPEPLPEMPRPRTAASLIMESTDNDLAGRQDLTPRPATSHGQVHPSPTHGARRPGRRDLLSDEWSDHETRSHYDDGDNTTEYGASPGNEESIVLQNKKNNLEELLDLENSLRKELKGLRRVRRKRRRLKAKRARVAARIAARNAKTLLPPMQLTAKKEIASSANAVPPTTPPSRYLPPSSFSSQKRAVVSEKKSPKSEQLASLLAEEASLHVELNNIRNAAAANRSQLQGQLATLLGHEQALTSELASMHRYGNGIPGSIESPRLVYGNGNPGTPSTPQVEAVRRRREEVQLSMQQKAFHLERLLQLETALEEEARLMRMLNAGGEDVEEETQKESTHSTVENQPAEPAPPVEKVKESGPSSTWDMVEAGNSLVGGDQGKDSEGNALIESGTGVEPIEGEAKPEAVAEVFEAAEEPTPPQPEQPPQSQPPENAELKPDDVPDTAKSETAEQVDAAVEQQTIVTPVAPDQNLLYRMGRRENGVSYILSVHEAATDAENSEVAATSDANGCIDGSSTTAALSMFLPAGSFLRPVSVTAEAEQGGLSGGHGTITRVALSRNQMASAWIRIQELYGATHGTMTKDNLFAWLTLNVLAGVVSGEIDAKSIDLNQLSRPRASLAHTLYRSQINGTNAGAGAFILPEVDFCGQPTAFEVLLHRTRRDESVGVTSMTWPLIASNPTDARIARHAFLCVSEALDAFRGMSNTDEKQLEQYMSRLVTLAKGNAVERKSVTLSLPEQISAVRTRASRSLLRKGRLIGGMQFTFVARQSR